MNRRRPSAGPGSDVRTPLLIVVEEEEGGWSGGGGDKSG